MTPPPPRSPWAVLASTSLAVFAVFLDTTILFVAFPAIRADFSEVSPSTLSWVLNAYTIVFAALLIPAGRLADRIGRRRTFLAAAVLFTVASMLCGLAPTAGLLVAARILQAVGAAALVPSSLALVLQTFPRSKIPSRWPSGGPSVPSPVPPDRRSAPSSSRTSAGAGPSSSTCPSGSSATSSAAGCCPRDARPTPVGSPTHSVWCCWPEGWPSPPSASS